MPGGNFLSENVRIPRITTAENFESLDKRLYDRDHAKGLPLTLESRLSITVSWTIIIYTLQLVIVTLLAICFHLLSLFPGVLCLCTSFLSILINLYSFE